MIPRAAPSALVLLALALALAAGGAQPAAAQTLHVVVLATVADVKQKPATAIPQPLRSNPLYWRVLRSAGSVSYQLCLGFFQSRDEAERARRQLLAGFPAARVI